MPNKADAIPDRGARYALSWQNELANGMQIPRYARETLTLNRLKVRQIAMQGKVVKKVSMSDIARVTGLSTMTVSRVLRDDEFGTEMTRKRVLAAAKKLNYEVNFIARQLKANQIFQLGVILSFEGLLGQHYFGQVLQGIQQVLTGTDYHVVLLDSKAEDFDDPQKCASFCRERHAGGLIVVAPRKDELYPSNFIDLKLPLVIVGRPFEHQSTSYVDVDNYGGACAMTDYLIRLGHTEIGFLKGPSELHDASQRELGYRKTMAKHKLLVQEKWVMQGDYELRKAFHICLQLLAQSDRPTAIFAANDQMAYGVIDAAQILGLRVPEDLSVGGFDDIEGSAEFVPALTTIAQPMQDIGRVAARYLLEVLDKSNVSSVLHQKLHTRLVIRSSASPPNGPMSASVRTRRNRPSP